jgi:hypothetical protein
MAQNDYLKGHTSTKKSSGSSWNQEWTSTNPGPYLGIVKGNKDPARMGRLKVFIPSLVKTQNPTEKQLITCDYLSPFYGAKGEQYANGASRDYTDSQHSYGFWAVPPDLDTKVLVIFAEGKMDQAYWIGCVQDPYTNHMTPGIAASANTWDKTTGEQEGPPGAQQTLIDKQKDYGTRTVPAGELNRNTPGALVNGNYESTPKPIHPFADVLLKQGLIADPIRGTTTSSARRETPSQVFGISTPGRKDTGTPKQKVGAKDSEATDYVTRTSGHTFVMDDGATDGTNQLTRLRTASGHQLLMHDTEGVVYIANGSGNAYIEMQSNGRIDIYSGVGGINMRTEGDFNLHSDSNINMHANGQVRFSSAKEMIHSADLLLNLGEKGILNSSQAGSVRDYARDGISSFTSGTQLHGASGQIHLAGSQVHFNSTSASPTWGPNWLTPEKAGMQLRDEGDVELAQKGIKPLEQFTRKTKTTVHRFVTHEPMFRASVIGNDGIIPIDSDDKKRWSQLANTPGTAEFINNQNRLSENSAIRDAQYQADALEYVKQKMGSSTDAAKARQLLSDFGTAYNDIYGITGKVDLPFEIKESISEKIKNSEFVSDATSSIKNLTSQVVEKFRGDNVELFKDNVFVNQAGELFTLGGGVDYSKFLGGDLKGFAADAGKTYLTGVGRKAIEELTTGNLSKKGAATARDIAMGGGFGGGVRNIDPTLGTLNSVTKTYSSVVGGKIVGMNQVKSLASKVGLFNARDASRLGQSFLQNVGVNLSSKIGAIGGAVKTFFSGFKFSDQRLKEDIKLVGKSPSGINIYSFKYKHTDGTYEGVMAQEVPWARTMTDTGFYMVDYNKVDVEFRRLD